ncbi:DUF494 family protein [Fangia hongkongensis]|uniref:DUF494 family protein n=1 Tax=Fangia hongkongensis TaxID=270495 RepID=UPI0003624994|nr:DUF494 family protein [Fangia hongkongensis]MBK2123674.1 DUF494 family protein [Fangia hongkongensis]
MKTNLNILQILMSLFNHVAIHEDILKITTPEEISQQLRKAGLNSKELKFVLVWLESFSKLPEKNTSISFHPHTIRVFSDAERAIIPNECLDFLAERVLEGEINAYEFEFILTQIMLINTHAIDEDEFMWVYDMTLANQEALSFANNEINSHNLVSFYNH